MDSTTEHIIGREDVDDIEAILAVSNTDVDEVLHAVRSNYDTIFTWDYDKGSRPKLNRLYEKAKTSMWNAQTDLPWDTDVDQAKLVEEQKLLMGPPLHTYVDIKGTAFEHWGEKEWDQLAIRAPSSAPPRWSSQSRGSTRSTTGRPRSWTRHVTSRCSPSTSTRSSPGIIRSTPT
jgi:hypothetical protein